MNYFFTADNHFGHANILGYCNRPFGNVTEMDEELIKRWNEVVKENDTVFHLGDFHLGSLSDVRHKYLTRLNGNIKFVIPYEHHDRRWYEEYTDSFDTDLWTNNGEAVILGPLETCSINSTIITMCHFPFARWDRMHYGSWHLHGHTHNRFFGKGLIYDVGVDANSFYPVSFTKLKEIMDKKSIFNGID